MSELKATTAQEIVRNEKDCDYMDELFGGVKMPPTQVYLKSEADKVIAELKAKNERLADLNLIKASETFREEFKKLRHSNYKRCLAMASLWLERSETSTDLGNELVSRKRCNKWLELAEKFKPNKEAK